MEIFSGEGRAHAHTNLHVNSEALVGIYEHVGADAATGHVSNLFLDIYSLLEDQVP